MELYILHKHLKDPLLNETLQSLCVKVSRGSNISLSSKTTEELFRQKIPDLTDATKDMLFKAAYADSHHPMNAVAEQLLPYVSARTLDAAINDKDSVIFTKIKRHALKDGVYGKWIQITRMQRTHLINSVIYDNAAQLTRHLCRYPEDVAYLTSEVTANITPSVRALYDAGHVTPASLLCTRLRSNGMEDLLIDCINTHKELKATLEYRGCISGLANNRKDLVYTITHQPKKGATL